MLRNPKHIVLHAPLHSNYLREIVIINNEVGHVFVTSYSATEIFETFSYNIGSPSLTSERYSFDEDKPCGYTETVTIEGLPAFMEHN